MKMKITKRQLRRIIKEAIIAEVRPTNWKQLPYDMGGPWVDKDAPVGSGSKEIDDLDRELTDKEIEDSMRGIDGWEEVESFKLPYRGTGYGGRRITSRDRAWLEFVPKGSDSLTPEDMFRAVTFLDNDDPEILKALKTGGPKSMGPLGSYDVYSVYATTTG
jgi:hypothetical protein